MGLFDNLFAPPKTRENQSGNAKIKGKDVIQFLSPDKPELCEGIVNQFNQEIDAITREALNAIARSFTCRRSANNIPVMSFPELTYWLEHDCDMPSIKKNWPKIIKWWLSGQGIHVRKESGKITSYRDFLPPGFFPVYFYDFETEMLNHIKNGEATVFNPELKILCKSQFCEQEMSAKILPSKDDEQPPAESTKKSSKPKNK